MCLPQLSELNGYVQVAALAEPAISPAVLARFHVVVATATPRAQLVAWNAFCHAQSPPIAFLAADVLGAAGFAFSDFGPAHGVRDPNGEVSKSATVVGIVRGLRPGPHGPRVTIECRDGRRCLGPVPRRSTVYFPGNLIRFTADVAGVAEDDPTFGFIRLPVGEVTAAE